MKAFLLAAGEGRRLRPLTDAVPKCLVTIQGRPLLDIWLHLLEANGVTDVLINVHHRPEQVLEFLRAHDTRLAVTITHEPTLLGSAGTVLANRAFADEEECFFIVYADLLTTVSLRDLARFHRSRRLPLTIGVTETDEPTQKGIVVVDGGDRVVEFVEKPARPRSRLANAGIYAAGQGLFGYLARMSADGHGDHGGRGGRVLDFGYDAVPRMVPDVAAYPIDAFLMDIGTPDAYARAQRRWPGFAAAAAPAD